MAFERGVLFIVADCISDGDDASRRHVTIFALPLLPPEYWSAFPVRSTYIGTIDVPRLAVKLSVVVVCSFNPKSLELDTSSGRPQ